MTDLAVVVLCVYLASAVHDSGTIEPLGNLGLGGYARVEKYMLWNSREPVAVKIPLPGALAVTFDEIVVYRAYLRAGGDMSHIIHISSVLYKHPVLIGNFIAIPLDEFNPLYEGDFFGVVEELCDGTLDSISSQFRYSLSDRLAYLGHAGRAVTSLNAKGFVYRDLKSANILICNQIAKISDFGLMHHIDDVKGFERIGTPDSTLPLVPGAKVDFRMDRFSMAFTLLELVSLDSFWSFAMCNTVQFFLASKDSPFQNSLLCVPGDTFELNTIDGVFRENILVDAGYGPTTAPLARLLQHVITQAFSPSSSLDDILVLLEDFQNQVKFDQFAPETLPSRHVYRKHFTVIQSTLDAFAQQVTGTFRFEKGTLSFFTDSGISISLSDLALDIKAEEDLVSLDDLMERITAQSDSLLKGLAAISPLKVGNPARAFFAFGKSRFPKLLRSSLYERCIALKTAPHKFPFENFAPKLTTYLLDVIDGPDLSSLIPLTQQIMDVTRNLGLLTESCEKVHFLERLHAGCSKKCVVLSHVGYHFSVLEEN